jgi:hypothetical protein
MQLRHDTIGTIGGEGIDIRASHPNGGSSQRQSLGDVGTTARA